jgi:acyl dehydratase
VSAPYGPPLGPSVGTQTRFRKTVSESDVYLFAGITGDLAPNHVDEVAMQATRFGGRIAHGALIVGYMSACSTRMAELAPEGAGQAVSLGYDSIRFLKAVRIGDTIEVVYEITAIEPERRRTVADIRVTNQYGELVAVARHIQQFV